MGEQDSERRGACGVPDEVGHREKWRLALDALDELAGWGLTPPVVVADAGYGQSHPFRVGLRDRGLDYITAVRARGHQRPSRRCRAQRARAGGAHRRTPPAPLPGGSPLGESPGHGSRTQAAAAVHLAAGQPRCDDQPVRRDGDPAGRCRSLEGGTRTRRRTLRLGRRPAGRNPPAEWPPHQPEPTDYWLTSLPADTLLRRLVRLAKIRWRIEHDYRELKHGLGLDHFEGRSWTGWHHHATLVTAAHAFLTEQRLTPKADTPACLSTRFSTPSRTC
jgi:SRSO17 transposase